MLNNILNKIRTGNRRILKVEWTGKIINKKNLENNWGKQVTTYSEMKRVAENRERWRAVLRQIQG